LSPGIHNLSSDFRESDRRTPRGAIEVPTAERASRSSGPQFVMWASRANRPTRWLPRPWRNAASSVTVATRRIASPCFAACASKAGPRQVPKRGPDSRLAAEAPKDFCRSLSQPQTAPAIYASKASSPVMANTLQRKYLTPPRDVRSRGRRVVSCFFWWVFRLFRIAIQLTLPVPRFKAVETSSARLVKCAARGRAVRPTTSERRGMAGLDRPDRRQH
jgi:hypothetical protein